MADEEAPLLSDAQQRQKDVYNRFSSRKKAVILGITCWCGLIPLFVSSSFTPQIPQVAKELHSDPSIINLAVSFSVLTTSVSSLLWATYSGYYGRRPIWLASLPILCAGSLGVAVAYDVPTLLLFRIIQAFGAAPGLSVGSGTIADIYRLEERGAAMGLFFCASLLGPALAPFVGGFATYYFNWRYMHYAFFVAALILLIVVAFLLPETSHPGARGVEKAGPVRGLVWLNPFKSFWLLQSPNLMATTMIGTAVLATDYVLLVPMAYTIAARYGITNEALIGLLFLPVGLGNTIGAPLAGRISDNVLIKWRKRRNGLWVPEDRLRATAAGLFLVPMSIFFSGVVTEMVPGTLGIVLNVICLFANGIGVDFVLSPSAAYCVDIFHAYSAEVMAVNNGFRGLIMACIIAVTLPSVKLLGVFYTDLIFALFAVLGSLLMYITIRHGERMRAWKDMGYSTIENT